MRDKKTENGNDHSSSSHREVRIDLHCHSIYSRDSILDLPTIVTRARELELFGVAITDHDRLPPSGVLERYSDQILLIPGIEVSTSGGHLLAFGIQTTPPKARSLSETIDFVRGQGGIPIFSHPYRMGDGVGTGDIEGHPKVLFEGLNGRSWMRYNQRSLSIGERLGRHMTGGSDAHDPTDIGRAWTVFPDDVQDVVDIFEALHKGTVQPGGAGLSFPQLVRSKAMGTVRWTNHYLGRGSDESTHIPQNDQVASQGEQDAEDREGDQ
jgi:predicted metal-dependent phosphoesterase TrpH